VYLWQVYLRSRWSSSQFCFVTVPQFLSVDHLEFAVKQRFSIAVPHRLLLSAVAVAVSRSSVRNSFPALFQKLVVRHLVHSLALAVEVVRDLFPEVDVAELFQASPVAHDHLLKLPSALCLCCLPGFGTVHPFHPLDHPVIVIQLLTINQIVFAFS
jgi:hypothetical protein